MGTTIFIIQKNKTKKYIRGNDVHILNSTRLMQPLQNEDARGCSCRCAVVNRKRVMKMPGGGKEGFVWTNYRNGRSYGKIPKFCCLAKSRPVRHRLQNLVTFGLAWSKNVNTFTPVDSPPQDVSSYFL